MALCCSFPNNRTYEKKRLKNNMVMEGYYAQDRLLAEIWQKIHTLHLSYLEMEDSPQKLDQRIKLEECIKDYLCLAPHNQKFYFHETAEVLHHSAHNKNDFSGYKASTGWNAIQMYAGNLLAQPWRKEYREIKTYCGFYKHQIEANLVGAELMFEAMGYKHAGNGVLVLEGPVCPDLVTNVSKDALVAYVECQILKAIWEEVSTNFKITWLDVLEFRENHLCSPKQSINALNYRYHQRQYQEHTRSYSQGTDRYSATANVHNTAPQILPSTHSFPPLAGHTHVPVAMPTQCIYATNGCCASNYATYAPVMPHYSYPVPFSYPQPLVKPQLNTNGYYCTNGYAVPSPNYIYPVPTGQLIELDPQNATYEVIDGPGNSRVCRTRANSNNKNDDTKIAKDSDKDEASFESWDYVYRNLESQGYSKDLGERGDVLSPSLETDKNRNVKEAKKVKSMNLDESMNTMAIVDGPLKITEALSKYNKNEAFVKYNKENEREKTDSKIDKKNADIDPSSSYENLSTHEVVVKKSLPKAVSNSISKTKTLLREKVSPTAKAAFSKTLDTRKPNKDKVAEQVNKWQCKFCTYLNETAKEVCEMCSKSKTEIQQTMEIGGSQCPQCTLVNPKENKSCAACDTSLKNSPTYI